jgi:hypothetical protein
VDEAHSLSDPEQAHQERKHSDDQQGGFHDALMGGLSSVRNGWKAAINPCTLRPTHNWGDENLAVDVKRSYGRLAIALTALAFPSAAHADVVWPALFVEQKLLSIPVIASGLLVEALVLRFCFRMNWKRAFTASVVVNAISTILGVLLIPLAGIGWELFPGIILYKSFNLGTFNPITWTATFLLALGITTSIEVACLRRLFGVPAGRRTWFLWTLANAVTVGLALASLVFQPINQ